MPASGALGPFMDAMIKLRAQRLEEAEAKDKGMMALGSGIGSGVSSLGSSLADAMKQGKADALANKLGGDPNAPWQGGGAREIELRKAMGQYSKSTGDDYYKQASFDLRQAANDRAERGEAIAAQQRTAAANRLLSEDSKKDINDALGFELQAKDFLSQMNNPGKPISAQEHSDLASKVRAVRTTAEKRGLPMAEFNIPPYVSTEEQGALAEYRTRQATALAAPSGTQSSWGSQVPTNAAQKYFESIRGVQSVPGQGIGPGPVYAPAPGEKLPALQAAPQPQQQQAPAAGGQRANGTPGTATGPNGEKVRTVWMNGQWYQAP